jgi:hypothetical protein
MQQSDLFPDERLQKLKAGKAVVVSVRKKDNDTVYQWAKENDIFVYCGRSVRHTPFKKSKWHNPYDVKTYGRENAIQLHKENLSDELKSQIQELKGKALGCWCHPLGCHCDHLSELANKHKS